MAINNALFEFNGQVIGATEYSLTNNSTTIAEQTTDAIISVWIDVANIAAGEEYSIWIRERVTSSSTQRQIFLATLVGPQGEPFVSSPFQVGNGWDVTMQRITGANRNFSWSIRAVT